jgi:hypothetical protein
MMDKMRSSIGKAQADMPLYFSERRVAAMRCVFEEMDADNGLTLDMAELCPFFDYVFYARFGCNLTTKEQELLYYILDTDMDSELGEACAFPLKLQRYCFAF